MKKFKIWLFSILAALVCFLVVLLLIIFAASSSVFSRSAMLSRFLSKEIHESVTMEGSSLHWHKGTAIIHVNKMTVSNEKQPTLPVLTWKGVDVHFSIWHALKHWRWVLDELHWDAFQAVASVNAHHQMQLGYPGAPLIFGGSSKPDLVVPELPFSTGSVLSLEQSALIIHGLSGQKVTLDIAQIDWADTPGRPFVLKWRLGNKGLYQSIFRDCGHEQGLPEGCRIHAGVKGLNLKPLIALFLPKLTVKTGLLDAQSDWLCTKQRCSGGLQDLSFSLGWQDRAKRSHNLSVRHVTGFLQHKSGGGWAFPIHWPVIDLNKAVVHDFTLGLSLDQQQALRVEIPAVDLPQWSGLVQAGLSSNDAKWLKELALTGQVKHLSWKYCLLAPKESVVSASLDDIGFHQMNPLPGVAHLKAVLTYQPVLQKIVLRPLLTQASLYWPEFLPAHLQGMNLKGVIVLSKQNTGWQLNMQKLRYKDAYLQLSLGGVMHFGPKFGHPFFDFNSQFSVMDLRHFKDYLPYSMPKSTRKWLVHGFLGGSMPVGKVAWKGPLEGFPYSHNEGKWLLKATLKDMKLHYSPGWPPLYHAGGEFTMKNNALSFKAPSAVLLGNPLSDASGYIPNVNHPMLFVNGHSRTKIQAVQRFLMNSPLPWGKDLQGVHFSGPGNIDIHLQADVSKKNGPVYLKGSLALNDASVYLSDWDVNLSAVKGVLNFTEKGLIGKSVHATLFSAPTLIQIKTKEIKHGGTALKLAFSGHLPMEQLYKQLPFAMLRFFHGKTHYKAHLSYGKSLPQEQNKLHVETDLLGVSVDLPGKLRKTVKTTRPMSVDVGLTKNKPFDLTVRYGEAFDAQVRLKQEKAHTVFQSGEIYIGVEKTQPPKGLGLVLKAKFDDFNLKQWLPVLQMFYKQPGSVDAEGRRHGVKWRAFDVSCNHLFWGKVDFSRLHVILGESPADWRFQLTSVFGKGVFWIPRNHESAYRVTLYKFDWKKFLNTGIKDLVKSNKAEKKTESLPKIKFICDQCFYGGTKFGWVELLYKGENKPTHKMAVTWRRKGVSMGSLLSWGDGRKSEWTGKLMFSDLGRVLKEYEHTPYVSQGEGDVHFSFSWPEKPLLPSLEKVSGFFRVRLSDILLTHLPKKFQSSMGLAKFINVLSVKHGLPIVGALGKGLHVDALSFSAGMDKEVLYTHDFRMKSTILNASASGSVDFLKKLIDMRVKVEPQVTGSLPIIATIAGGPVVGLFAYVLNKVIEPLVGKATALNYAIKGKLSDPAVLKVD